MAKERRGIVPAVQPAAKQPAPAKNSAPQLKPQAHSQNQPKPKQAQSSGRLNPIKLRQMKERQRSIEDEVTRLEVEIADFEHALSTFQSADQSIEIASLLESRRTDMTQLLAEWEEVSATIDSNR